MQKLIIYSTLLTLLGCQNLGNSSSSVSSSKDCSEKPSISLRENDVQEISLNEKIINKSGQANASKAIGYKFQGESGQKLSYSTEADICIWLFAPDNEIITTRDLQKTGKYILQVSAPQGAKSFDLQMSLGIPQAATSSNSLSSSTTPSTVSHTNESPNNPNRSEADVEQTSNSNTKPIHDITQEQALKLVQKWYQAKPRIFGPPYDTNLVAQLATGKLYSFTTASDGSVAWLENNNAYYSYTKLEITNVLDFSNFSSRPYIKVRVFEELYLHGSNGIDRKNSGTSQNNFIYVFEKENGNWKIYDYRNVNQ